MSNLVETNSTCLSGCPVAQQVILYLGFYATDNARSTRNGPSIRPSKLDTLKVCLPCQDRHRVDLLLRDGPVTVFVAEKYYPVKE